MSDTNILGLADAVVTAINGDSGVEEYIGDTEAAVAFSLDDVDDLQVKVVPSDVAETEESRGGDEDHYVLHVVTRQKLDRLDVSGGRGLVNLVAALFRVVKLEQVISNAALVEKRFFPFFSPKVLDETGYFYSVLVLTFREWVDR